MTVPSNEMNKLAAAPGLTEQEAAFLLDVFQQPATKLDVVVGVWAVPEEIGLVWPVGTYKWVPQASLRARLMQALTAVPATTQSAKISTWRERIGQAADFPLHVPTDVERAMVAEIAELRAAVAHVANLEAGLRYYAEGHHFEVADSSAWDTCSGEPINFYFDEAGTAQVEDGSLAKMVLAGEPMLQGDEEILVAIPKSEGSAVPNAERVVAA